MVETKLDDKYKKMKYEMVKQFFNLLIDQTRRHNSRYFGLHGLIRSCFAEKEIGSIFANYLLKRSDDSPVSGMFVSPINGQKIDLKAFADKLKHEVELYMPSSHPFDK